jgi:hypothetical protein
MDITIYGRCLVDITNIQYWLIGKEVEIPNCLALLRSKLYGTCRETLLQRLLIAAEDVVLTLGNLIASGSLLLALAYTVLDGLEVLELKLSVDDALIAHRVHGAINVCDVIVLEATQHVDNSVGVTNVGKELITKTLTLGCTLHQASDIDNLDGCWYNTLRVVNLHELSKALIGYGDHTHVGLNSTEGEVCRLRTSV